MTVLRGLRIGGGSCALLALIATLYAQAPRQGSEAIAAIVGATVIDGNGGPPLPDATIVIRGEQIVNVGARRSVTVPAGAQVIDGTGKYALPGLIDTNVH